MRWVRRDRSLPFPCTHDFQACSRPVRARRMAAFVIVTVTRAWFPYARGGMYSGANMVRLMLLASVCARGMLLLVIDLWTVFPFADILGSSRCPPASAAG